MGVGGHGDMNGDGGGVRYEWEQDMNGDGNGMGCEWGWGGEVMNGKGWGREWGWE